MFYPCLIRKKKENFSKINLGLTSSFLYFNLNIFLSLLFIRSIKAEGNGQRNYSLPSLLTIFVNYLLTTRDLKVQKGIAGIFQLQVSDCQVNLASNHLVFVLLLQKKKLRGFCFLIQQRLLDQRKLLSHRCYGHTTTRNLVKLLLHPIISQISHFIP